MDMRESHDDWVLLRQFVETGSETAFEALVREYVDHVFAIAVRQTKDPHLAQDVTQAVFLVLVRKAHTIPAGTVLSGWFFSTTRHVALTAVRREQRRSNREASAMKEFVSNAHDTQITWEQLRPHIDEALATLKRMDRDVVLLRFFRQQTIRATGEALGLSDDAVQKRTARAIDKLRDVLQRHGITSTTAALLTAMSSFSAEAAPASVSKAIVSSLTNNDSTVASSLADYAAKSMEATSMVSPAIAAGVVLAASLIAVAGIATRAAPTRVFELSEAFSEPRNPNGPWSFGWSTNVGGDFKPLRFRQTVVVTGGLPIQSWQFGSGKNPAIYHNAGTTTWNHKDGPFAPGEVWFHAGNNWRPENFGVIRFTVPPDGDGTQKLHVTVQPQYRPGLAGDSDFHVAVNGVEVFGEFLPADRGTGYTNSFKMRVGDTIDLVVGRGADGDEYASGLRVSASIQGPDPGR